MAVMPVSLKLSLRLDSGSTSTRPSLPRLTTALEPLAVVTVLSPSQDVTGLHVRLGGALLDAGWETGSGATSVHIDTSRPAVKAR